MTISTSKTNQTPLKQGILWNLASLGFLAIAGLLLNFAIARFYGANALGVFNLAFAFYILASQFGSFGIHLSILESVSRYFPKQQDFVDKSVISAILILAIISTITVIVFLLLIPLIEDIYSGKAAGIGKACLAMAPGLWAFSINKGFYSIINGARHMRAFAALQALRYVLILASFLVFYLVKTDYKYLIAVFSISEMVLLPVLGFYSSKIVNFKLSTIQKLWLDRHIWFGSRVFLSGAILELNTRVDVLMIGYFLNAEKAGIYSIAALISEGAGQAIFAIRNNFNPIITKLVRSNDVNGLLKLSRQSVLFFVPFMLFISLASYFIFTPFCKYILGNEVYLQSLWPLMILLFGLTISSGLLAFNMIFSQSGKPMTHTILVLAVLLANTIFNFLLIPVYGIMGAAIATSLSYIISVIFLIIATKWFLGMRLLI